MTDKQQKKVLDKDGLMIENIIVKDIFTKDNVIYLSEKDCDGLFGVVQNQVDDYDWSFSWENAIHGQSVKSFVAPVNGWFSIDSISGTDGIIKINDSIGITIQNTGSFQAILKTNDVVSCTNTTFTYSFVPCNGEINK